MRFSIKPIIQTIFGGSVRRALIRNGDLPGRNGPVDGAERATNKKVPVNEDGMELPCEDWEWGEYLGEYDNCIWVEAEGKYIANPDFHDIYTAASKHPA